MSGPILHDGWMRWLAEVDARNRESDQRMLRMLNDWRSTGEPDKAQRGAGGEQTPETGATQ